MTAIIITAACPSDLIASANHLAMCLAYSEADALTYRDPSWQDTDGNLYAAASFSASQAWITGAQQALVRPAWDVGQIIDMEAAARAQAAMVFWVSDMGGQPPQAAGGALTVIGGMDGLSALMAMGLARVGAVSP
ncbi:hypothetical protein [Celeribacter ethanolicus]|uniref:hypothetical protein n=1 Tax=Celeribacter ethanolicus TaxID=1758178 RepID=UPI000835F0D1|nr:hypothetical protein [Celeribacter ethanolicus]